jgi:hypothetical protein
LMSSSMAVSASIEAIREIWNGLEFTLAIGFTD